MDKNKQPTKSRKKHFVPIGTGQTGPKLKPEERSYILRALATGASAPLIVQELKEQFGKSYAVKNIYRCYKHNPKYKPVIASLRAYMEKEIMKQPLASAAVRLEYLQRGINLSLKESVDKLYFHEGQLVGKVMKVNHGNLPNFIREAREEIAFLTGKNPNGASVHINLVNVIKEVSTNGNGYKRVEPEGKAGMDTAIAVKTDTLGQESIGDIEIL
jgi:hypothetical protein